MRRKFALLAFALAALAAAAVWYRRTPQEPVSRVAWPVMGTIAALQTAGAAAEDQDAARAAIQRLWTRHEKLLSAWDPDSELSRLARAGCTNWLDAVSPEVRPCYAVALALDAASGHAFNPRLGARLRALGFSRGGVYSDFDLGAVAKGFSVDAAAERLAALQPRLKALVDLGGNLRVCGDRAWRTGVRDPFRKGRYAAVFTLTNGEAVATSGNYERFVVKNGRRVSHVLDGRTGEPTAGTAAVTVVHPFSATLADGLSTTLFVLGPEEGARFLARHHPEAFALWIPDAPEEPTLLATPNFIPRLAPAPGWTLTARDASTRRES